MKYKALIIEDEKRAQILLQNIIETNFDIINIVAICDDLPSGVKAIHKHNPDLVFLDIEMPHYKGLEILDFFNEEQVNFSIIFTTAYNNYAINALKISAVDYLLKPITKEAVEEAIKRFELRNKKDNSKIFGNLKTIIHDNKITNFVIPEANQLHFIDPNQIVYIKADNSYCDIFFDNNTKLTICRSIKKFEESLQYCNFLHRIHKSYIVNINKIKTYNRSNGGSLNLTNNIELPVSSEKIQVLLNKVNKVNR